MVVFVHYGASSSVLHDEKVVLSAMCRTLWRKNENLKLTRLDLAMVANYSTETKSMRVG